MFMGREVITDDQHSYSWIIVRILRTHSP